MGGIGGIMRIVVLLIMLPFLLPIVIALIFIVKLFLKGKAQGWKGEVIDKSHNTKHDDDHPRKLEHFYSLKVKMTNGEVHNIAVSSEFYQTCEIGDTVEKPKGAIFPRKV